jgi:drug/metabolite transporter (DMT)-like permease
MIPDTKSPRLADIALLYAATMWGLFWYPLRLFEQAGLPALWVSLIAFSSALLVGLFYTRTRLAEYRSQPLSLLIIAVAAGWCNVAFLIALVEGNAIRVVLLFYLSPVWTVVMGHFILKEKLRLSEMLIFLLAFTGAMVMLWNPEVGLPWPGDRADWLALSSGFMFALSNILIRSLQTISIPVKTTASWMGGVGIAAVWILLIGSSEPGTNFTIWSYAILLGVLGIVFMTLAVQYGVTHMPVYRSAIILLFEIPVTAVSVYYLAGDKLSLLEWVGGIIVVSSAWLIARRGKMDGK